MNSKRKEKILATKITDLGFATATKNKLIRLFVGAVAPSSDDSIARDIWFSENEKRLEELTVKEIMEVVNSVSSSFNCEYLPLRGIRAPSEIVHFIKKLAKLGFTRLDWIYLPQETLTEAVTKKMKLSDWKKQSVILLGTLSAVGLREIAEIQNEYKEPYHLITIGDLLNTPCGKRQRDNTSIRNTRAKLLALGFKYKDGPFLQDSTKRQLIEKVQKENNLKPSQAKLIVRIAAERGWIGTVD